MASDAADSACARRLRWLVSGVGTVGVLAAGAAAAVAAREPADARRVLVALGVVAVARVLPLRVRIGSHDRLNTWGETALLVGLALVPLAWLLCATWVGVALVHLAARRGPVKALYNAGSATLGTLVGGAIVLATPGGPFGSAGAAAAYLAAAAGFFAVTRLFTAMPIALSRQRPALSGLADGVRLDALLAAGNAVTALAVLALAGWDLASLVLLPVALASLYQAYAGGLRSQQERDTWLQLEQATRDLTRLDRDAVLVTAARRAVELFRADQAEIVVPGAHGPQVVRAGADGTTVTGSAARSRPGELAAVSRRLVSSTATVGELRLCFDRLVRLSEREERALSTFGHALASALLNADLYEQMRAHAARKAHEAAHDPLTGLANRTVLLQRSTAAIEAGLRNGAGAALLLLDLDHFKEVNDTLGHEAGDLLLLEVADRLRGQVRPADTVVRLGGDEFAVLVPELAAPGQAEQAAAELHRALATPVTVHGLQLPVEASVGIACTPTDAVTVRELLRCADVAMYQAKRSGQPVARYRADLDPASVDRLSLVAELPTALERGELALHYQPKVDLRTGAEIGVEALVRWHHPRRGLLGAEEFVSLVEHSGIVHDFSLHVLDLALADVARWTGGGRPATVAVNLSARNLLDGGLPADVGRLLARHGIDAGRLLLEITETVMMSELEVVDRVLAELRGMGCQLSVDDFGTGYSSLTFLSRMRVDEVKIDRSFVAAMLGSAGDAAIVRAILELAHSLGMRVVAEGVETAEQLAALTALGCDAAQGYHIGSPRPYAERRLRALPGLDLGIRSA